MESSAVNIRTGDLTIVPAEDTKLWTKPWYINRTADEVNVGRITFKGKPEAGAVEVEILIKEDYRGRNYGKQALRGIRNWAAVKDGVHYIIVHPKRDDEIAINLLKKLDFYEDQEFPGLKATYVFHKQQIPWTLIMASMFLSAGIAIGYTVGYVWQCIIGGLVIGVAIGVILSRFLKKRSKKAYEEWSKHRAALMAGKGGGKSLKKHKR